MANDISECRLLAVSAVRGAGVSLLGASYPSCATGPGFMDWQKTEFLRERMNKDRQE